LDSIINQESEWSANRSKLHAQKQINLLVNRINLLKIEEERAAKRIGYTKVKTMKILEMKKRNQEISLYKSASIKNEEAFLKLLQKEIMNNISSRNYNRKK
ncbi:hypothetical protein IMG5_188940, partial [Ichthyophthirius multifiliis]